MELLNEHYKKNVVPELMKKFNYTSIEEVPKLVKIMINVGFGPLKENSKSVDNAIKDLTIITGQKPIETYARKSIANFKLRQGEKIGAKVTLRRDKMFAFFNKFTNVAVPRIRDFKGLNPKSFDGRGNYTVGIKEQLIFPEIEFDQVDKIIGMDITFVTTAKSDDEAREMLKLLGMPFRK